MAGAAEQRRRFRLREDERKLRDDLNALYKRQLAEKDAEIEKLKAEIEYLKPRAKAEIERERSHQAWLEAGL